MNKRDEIESLNLDQLDVEELEHRLEMAAAAIAICYHNGECPGNNPNPCTAHVTCPTNTVINPG